MQAGTNYVIAISTVLPTHLLHASRLGRRECGTMNIQWAVDIPGARVKGFDVAADFQ